VDRNIILALKNLLFTLVVPGTVGVYLPLILVRTRTSAFGPGFPFSKWTSNLVKCAKALMDADFDGVRVA